MYRHYNQLSVLEVTGLPKLNELICNNNQLTSLSISSLTKLNKFLCHNNQLTSIDISGLTKLKFFSCYNNKTNTKMTDNQPPPIYHPGDVAVVNAIITNNGLKWELAPEDGSCIPNDWLTAWSDEATNKRITLLQFYCASLTGALDVSRLTELQNLHCETNEFTSIDVSGLTKLEEFFCFQNQLTALNLSTLTGLKNFDCSENQLSSLDVSASTEIEALGCSKNRLTALDVSALTILEVLECDSNQLTALDVSGLTMLAHLNCTNNQLTSLDLSLLGNTLTEFEGDGQSPEISLTGSSPLWQATVDFGDDDNVVFAENEVLIYASKTLSSNNNSASRTAFIVKTGLEGKTLTGTLMLAYLEQ